MKNKNLIIGAATGYQKNELYFFVESLRKVYFDKVILIVNKNITEETRNYLNLNKIDIFFTKYKSKTIFPDLGDNFIYDDFIIKLNPLSLQIK